MAEESKAVTSRFDYYSQIDSLWMYSLNNCRVCKICSRSATAYSHSLEPQLAATACSHSLQPQLASTSCSHSLQPQLAAKAHSDSLQSQLAAQNMRMLCKPRHATLSFCCFLCHIRDTVQIEKQNLLRRREHYPHKLGQSPHSILKIVGAQICILPAPSTSKSWHPHSSIDGDSFQCCRIAIL